MYIYIYVYIYMYNAMLYYKQYQEVSGIQGLEMDLTTRARDHRYLDYQFNSGFQSDDLSDSEPAARLRSGPLVQRTSCAHLEVCQASGA